MTSDLILKYKNKTQEIYNRAYYGKCITTIEMECREKLINDLLEFLGYNLKDDVFYEFGGHNRIDYWLPIGICLEAKKLHLDSNSYIYDYVLGTREHREQLYRYLEARKCPLGILSNGVEWQFFRKEDYSTGSQWTPFRTVNLKYADLDDFEFLECFRREVYSKNNLNEIYTKFSFK